MVEHEELEIVAMVSKLNIDMITELNMADATKDNDWWYDSGATIHVCKNLSLFKSYEKVSDDSKVLMGNHNASTVVGKGTIELEFTSGKRIVLVNVFTCSRNQKKSGFCKSPM